ncbi:dihydrofolate reductase family protein [Dyadobacter sp. Leaf189]|uniref:dihydrofolate reductase family protein n=1 Tax=Dyadobacter sp. Leaf189 TaxID=1736295 RepID=UPI0006FF0E5A|nr:dihydrofolate reductase family protein [Dyadobacter sp. Leaf189]KQS27994.1 riboflavin biosynthesis protein RibD [Dyadobacter sp. Leaf189]
MRKIIINEFLTLDGVIQGPGGPGEDTTGSFELGGWVAKKSDDISDEILMEIMMQPYDLLLGRVTYEIWEPYWPAQTGPIAEKFTQVKKYVASRTRQEGSWRGTVFLNGDAVEQVKALKASDGPDLQMWGSADFIHSLMEHGLIDQMNIFIHPIILGKGKKLFCDGAVPGNFKLTRHTVSTKGVILATYEADGEVEFGNAGE